MVATRAPWLVGCAFAMGALAAAGRADAQPAPPAPDPSIGAAPGAPRAALEPSASEAQGVIKKKPAALTWDPRFRPADGYDYTLTAIMGAGALGSYAFPSSATRWVTPDGFDKSVRDALRIQNSKARDVARDASDALLTLNINTLVLDSLAVAWWGRDRRSIAWQMLAIDAEALSVTAFVQGFTAGLTSRERPYHDRCVGPLLQQTDDCRSSNRYRSFFSGHTSISFTAAGLMCQHHGHLPLYGGGAPDVLACVVAIAAAGTTGYLRVASDQHYASDVLVGAAVGSLSGFGLPWLLHYRGGANSAPPLARALPGGGYVTLAPSIGGGGVMGAF